MDWRIEDARAFCDEKDGFWNWATELVRLIAEAGWGIEVRFWTFARVCSDVRWMV